MKPEDAIDGRPGSILVYEPRPVCVPRLKHATCQGCGAPLRATQDKCEYCDREIELVYEEMKL